jgi:hypothetical protein
MDALVVKLASMGTVGSWCILYSMDNPVRACLTSGAVGAVMMWTQPKYFSQLVALTGTGIVAGTLVDKIVASMDKQCKSHTFSGKTAFASIVVLVSMLVIKRSFSKLQ